MAAISRFGPSVIRSTLLQHQRQMASATTASDPIQRVFLEKIKEFKASNKGLDAAHQKALVEEEARLKRVYNIEDGKLTRLESKFPKETPVSLRDLDESKERRKKIASGEFVNQLAKQNAYVSPIVAAIPPQPKEYDPFHMPPTNKPDATEFMGIGTPAPAKIGEDVPDYEYIGGKMTPEAFEKSMNVKFGDNMPTIHDDESPERDTVNFPRLKPNLYEPATRFHIIPETWFKFFHPKTGHTGPYVFAGTFFTFLFSKEWLVMEHEMLTAFSSTVIVSYAVIKFGPRVKKFLVDNMKSQVDGWENWRTGTIQTLEQLQNHYKNQLSKDNLIGQIYSARKADVENQLELEYRKRIQNVFDETKRRLNYLVALRDSQQQIAHKNIVNWVISNSVSSIGPKQENEIFDSCIAKLKQMSSEKAKAI